MNDPADSTLSEVARESERRFRAMADDAPVLIWVAGLDRGCTWFNRAWLEFTGRTLEQEQGSGWTEGVHPEDLARCLDVYGSHFDRRAPFSMEYRLRRHDGAYRWLLDTGKPVFDPHGAFQGYAGSCVDITERAEAAARLRESEERLAAVIEGSSDGFLDLDLVTGLTTRSARCWELAGWTPDRLPPDSAAWFALTHDDDLPAVQRMLDGLVSGRVETADEEYRIQAADGTWRWLRARLKVVARDAAGRPSRIAGTLGDAGTTRARLEHALDAARLRGLADRMNEAELVVTLDGAIVEANDRALALYGRRREELIGAHVRVLRAPETHAAIAGQLARAATPEGVRFETVHVRSDGTRFPVAVSSRAFEVGGRRYLHSLVRDLTAKRAQEAGLRLLARITRSTADAVIVADPGLRILEYTGSAERLYGWTRAEALGKNLRADFTLEFPAGDRDAFRAAMARREQTRALVRALRKDGTWIDLDLLAVPLQDEAGTFEGWLSVGRDVSAQVAAARERQLLGERALQSERLLAAGTLARGMTHELNSPLSSVRSNVAYALEQLADARAGRAGALDEIAQALADAGESAERMRELLVDLRTFAIADAPGGGTRFSLAEAVEDARRIAAADLVPCAGVEVSVPEVGEIALGYRDLVQLLAHLLANAGQATGRDPNHVRVEALEEPGAVVVRVSDTGVGMSEATRARAFEPFFTTRGHGRARGLGLSVCLGMAQAAGGDVRLESVPGRGTTVTVRVPRGAARDAVRD